jgi:fatty-acyl-CoA synthase
MSDPTPPRTPIAGDVATLLINNALRDPGGTALVHDGTRISWVGLENMAARAARGLAELGVESGDRVAIWLPNVPQWFALYFACSRLGAIAVAVNTRFRAVEVADIVSRSGAKVLACMPGFRRIDFLAILADIDPAALDGLQAVITVGSPVSVPPAIERRRRVAWDELMARPPHASTPGSGSLAAAGCNIFTTSGTTKAPKFVLHRQGAIAAHAHRVARRFGFAAPETVSLAILPHCGVYGFNQAMATFAAGKPVVQMEAFDVEEALRLIAEYRPTTLFGGDDIFHRLLEASRGDVPFPSVKWAGYAAFNSALADIVEVAELRGLMLCGLYGMSEVQALYAAWPADRPAAIRKLGGGFPTSGLAHVRARDPETGALLAAGETGELECMGPSRMVAYFGDEAATRAALTDDGYLRTGDLGYVNDDGSFVYLSRMGDVLRLAGFLVNPLEIESHLQAHPSVEGSQVVAVARPEGQRAVAFVVLADGAGFDEGALIEHCRRGLANYKVPERVFPVDAFPTTPSANGPKIQRAQLRAMANERMG